jgi:hypothetical protein
VRGKPRTRCLLPLGISGARVAHRLEHGHAESGECVSVSRPSCSYLDRHAQSLPRSRMRRVRHVGYG